MDEAKKKKLIVAAGIVVFLIIMAVITFFVGKPLIKFIDEPEKFREWIDGLGVGSRLVFIGMVALQVIVALIPGEPFEIAGGYAFGSFEGTLLVVAGILVGSAVVYLFSKRFGTLAAEAFFTKEKLDSFKFLKDTKKVEALVFILFFIPGTPKDILTYIAPFTKLSFLKFMLIAGIARIPSVVTSTVGGGALGSRNYTFAVIVFAATLVVSVAGALLYNGYLKRKNRLAAAAEGGEEDQK